MYIYCLLQWNVNFFFCNSRSLCRVPWARHSAKIFQKKIYNFFAECLAAALGKVFFLKKIQKFFAECLNRGTRQRQSIFFKKIQKFFAECLNRGTRLRNYLKKIKKTLPSAWAGALGKVILKNKKKILPSAGSDTRQNNR